MAVAERAPKVVAAPTGVPTAVQRHFLILGWTLVAIIAGAGLLAQSLTYLNHDVAWVLYSSARLIDHGQFGRDIVAVNPPLIWWISALPMEFSRLTDLPPAVAFRLITGIILAGSLVWSNRLLKKAKLDWPTRLSFLLAAAFLFTVGIGRDFGQREHLATMLVIPYLLIRGLASNRNGTNAVEAMLAGIAAGIAVAFKPHFLLIPAFVEIASLIRTRHWRSLLSVELLALMFVLAGYLLAVLAWARPWLTEVVPIMSQLYWAFSTPTYEMVVSSVPLMTIIVIFGVGGGILFKTDRPAVSQALYVAALAFMGAAMWQSKGYGYHIFPAHALLLLALVAGYASARRISLKGSVEFVSCIILFVISAVSGGFDLWNLSRNGLNGREIEAATRFVATNTAQGDRFAAMSTHPFPGFPTAVYAHRDWVSASNSMLYMPAVIRLRAGDPDVAEHRDKLPLATNLARQAVLRDLDQRPELVLIDRRPIRHAIRKREFDYLDFFLEHPEFRKRWSRYERIEGAPNGFEAYRLTRRSQ